MNYTKEEVLELHELDRKMAWAKLARWGVIKDLTDAENELMVESLADCAFRLRDEDKLGFRRKQETVMNTCKFNDWDLLAQPIHWIMTALLAKIERKGKQC